MVSNKSAFLIIAIFVIFIISVKLFGIVITGKPIESAISKLIIGEEGNGDDDGDSGNGNGGGDGGTTTIKPQCNDKKDNDKDNLIDFPSDPGCVNYKDNNETNGRLAASINLNVKIHEGKKQVSPGDEVLADVQITNLGDLRPIDIFLKCNIEHPEGEVLVYYAEYLNIDKKFDVVRNLNVPLNASGGQYDFICFVTFKDQQISSSDVFTVISQEEPGFIEFDYSLILLIILIILIILRMFSLALVKPKKKAKPKNKKIKARIKKKSK